MKDCTQVVKLSGSSFFLLVPSPCGAKSWEVPTQKSWRVAEQEALTRSRAVSHGSARAEVLVRSRASSRSGDNRNERIAEVGGLAVVLTGSDDGKVAHL